MTIRPSLKRTLSNPAKVAQGGGSWRKGWKQRALKPPPSERERGRGSCYWRSDGAKGAESSLQSCTVLFCTIKWHGGQSWDNGLLSQQRRPAVPKESSLSAHMVVEASQDAPLAAAACSASGHIRSTIAARRPLMLNGVSPVTRQQHSRIQVLRRLRKGSTSGLSEMPILLDLKEQKSRRKRARIQ